MSVIIRVDWEGITYDLDIQEDIPLRLDISAIENTEIGEFFGVGSQTFNLPGTKNNNKFFKHAYNVGGEDIPAFYNTIDGRILSRGETLLKGQFQLLEVTKDEEGYVVYKCQIADETVQFKDVIQNKLIKNADWSSYQHTLNTGSILDSWDGNLLGGKVFYPLAHYGYNDPESQGNYPTFAFSETGTGNFINTTFSPLQPQQFLPAIKAKDVLEVICAQAGFSASGDFINSDDFSNLYILPKGKEELGITISGSEQATGYATNNYNQSIPIGSTPAIGTILALNNIVVDPQNKFNVSGSQGYGWYDADGNGEYEASAQIGFFNPVSFAFGEVQIDLKLVRGTFPFSSVVMAEESRTFSSADGFNTFFMNTSATWTSTTDEDVWIYVDYYYTSGTPTNDLNLFGFSSKLQINKAPEVYNDATVDMGLQWPADLKSIDIIKGLVQQFNLVVYPSPTQDKTIIFEQFDEWIRSGAQKDWTDKWDTAVRTSINHTVDEEPQELILGNEEDSDRFSIEAKESDPYYQYGTLRILANNNISQGSKSIKNTFGPVVLGGPLVSGSVTSAGVPTNNIDLGSNFAFPHLYKFENNQVKSYKFRPRLGYKVTNSFPSGSIYKLVLGNSFDDNTTISGSYGTLANVNGLPAINGTDDLHFNNSYFKFAGAGLNLSNTTTNFDRYWKTYIDSLYWDGNRKVTLDVKFNTEEYKDLRLNDIIFIKDQQYRINKIEGFNLTNDDIVTVELIRLYPQYYQNNPNCDFSVTVEPADCDFTFQAYPGFAPTSTPTPTPTTAGPIDEGVLELEGWRVQVASGSDTGSIDITWMCPVNQEIITDSWDASFGFYRFVTTSSYQPYVSNTGSVTLSLAKDVVQTYQYSLDYSVTQSYSYSQYGSPNKSIATFINAKNNCQLDCQFVASPISGGIPEISVISGSLLLPNHVLSSWSRTEGPFSCPTLPTPTPTLPTPTTTSGPVVPTPTPSPTATPTVYSYTGLAGYANYLAACSGSEVTIYTSGPIGTGSIAYENASLTNVFDFYRFFIDSDTGIGYEFVDPNTTGQVIDVQEGACNVETFRLFIDFNEYDACTETVVNTLYAASGSTLTNGTVLYEDINLEYSWYGQTGTEIKFIESGSSPRQIYYNTATGVSQSGTDICFTVSGFNGSDYTATTPPSPTCGVYEKTLYLQDSASIGSVIYTDANLTDPIFTGNNWVYNDDANELYRMSGSTGGDGSGWVIGEITSSACTPPAPTPTPTPSTIVTQMNVSASYSSYYEACTNPGATGTVYKADIWSSVANDYETYFYEDSGLTDILDFYRFIVDEATGDGYQFPDPNTTGRVIATGSDVCTISEFDLWITFNEYDACSQTVPASVYVAGNHTTMSAGLSLYENPQLTDSYDGYDFLVSGSDLRKWEIVGGVTAYKELCSGSDAFGGARYTSTTPPSPTCGFDERDFYVYTPIGLGTIIYTDQAKTSPLISSYQWVYNNDDNELYRMVSGEITEITGSVCTPAPTPTPTPDVRSYTMQRGYDAASQTCGTTYGQQTVYTDGPIGVGKIMYEDSSLTTNVDFYEYWRDISTDTVYRASTLTGEVLQNLGAICPTPTATPVPTPTPTPSERWVRLYAENCTNSSNNLYYNWYGDPNNFPAALMYDYNNGWCMDMYYDGEGYNAAYDDNRMYIKI